MEFSLILEQKHRNIPKFHYNVTYNQQRPLAWKFVEIHILRKINSAIFHKAVWNLDSFTKWEIILFLLFWVPETQRLWSNVYLQGRIALDLFHFWWNTGEIALKFHENNSEKMVKIPTVFAEISVTIWWYLKFQQILMVFWPNFRCCLNEIPLQQKTFLWPSIYKIKSRMSPIIYIYIYIHCWSNYH